MMLGDNTPVPTLQTVSSNICFGDVLDALVEGKSTVCGSVLFTLAGLKVTAEDRAMHSRLMHSL